MCRVVTLLVWLVLISSLWRLEPLQLMSKLTTWRFVWNCLDSLPISLAITLLNLVFKDNYLDTLNICCNPRDLWYSLFTLQIQKFVLEWVLQKKVNLHKNLANPQMIIMKFPTINTQQWKIIVSPNPPGNNKSSWSLGDTPGIIGNSVLVSNIRILLSFMKG